MGGELGSRGKRGGGPSPSGRGGGSWSLGTACVCLYDVAGLAEAEDCLINHISLAILLQRGRQRGRRILPKK